MFYYVLTPEITKMKLIFYYNIQCYIVSKVPLLKWLIIIIIKKICICINFISYFSNLPLEFYKSRILNALLKSLHFQYAFYWTFMYVYKTKTKKKKIVLPTLFPLLPLFLSVLSYRCWIFPFEDVNAVCFWAVVVIHNQHNIVCTVIDIAMVYVKRGHCCCVIRFAV